MSVLSNYPFLCLTSEIQEICKPLNQLDISCLVFVRRYTSGKEVCLSTEPGWTQYFYDNQLYRSLILDKTVPAPLATFKPHIYPWTQFEDSRVRLDQSKYFGVGLGLTIEYPREDHVDLFHFGAKNENTEMKGLILSYQEYLTHFVYYFYEKTHKLLEGEKATNYLIKLADREPYSGLLNLKGHGSHTKICDFIKHTNTHSFLLPSHRKGNILVTKREAECLYYLARGYTSAQIATEWSRSIKTVEKTIENTKFKLGIEKGETKKDLISEALPLIIDLLNQGLTIKGKE